MFSLYQDPRFVRGDASKFIKQAGGNLPISSRIVLAIRESSWKQDKNENLKDQEENLRRACRENEWKVVGAVRHVGSGWNPAWLWEAVSLAWKEQAVILAETTDRLVRSSFYHSVKSPWAQARETDLEDLRSATASLPLFTLLDPNASPEEVRSFQSKRGRAGKNRMGGRPKRIVPKVTGERRRLIDLLVSTMRTLKN